MAAAVIKTNDTTATLCDLLRSPEKKKPLQLFVFLQLPHIKRFLAPQTSPPLLPHSKLLPHSLLTLLSFSSSSDLQGSYFH